MSLLFPFVLALAGCSQTTAIEGDFDGPVGAAVLMPEQGGPFNEPVAFVSNSRSGRIVPLDVKHGWQLSTSSGAPYLEAAHVATGAERILGELAVYAPDTETVTLFVADARNEVLLRQPYVVGATAAEGPTIVQPELVDEVSFVDADDSGDAVTLDRLQLRRNAAGTEDWVVEFDGSGWVVQGSRSGLQQRRARALAPYTSDDGAISFYLEGSATKGDRLEFSVTTGAEELELGGPIEALHMLPGQELLLATVYDRDTDGVSLLGLDPATGAELSRVDFEPGAHPYRIASDRSGDLVYLADARRSVVYEFVVDPADLAGSPMREIALGGPAVDMAWQSGADYEHLFVAVDGRNSVEIYDLARDEWVDVNPVTPEIEGIQLFNPVTGLGASLEPVVLQEEGEWDARLEDSVVAISSFGGELFVAEGRTGCLALEGKDQPEMRRSWVDSKDPAWSDNGDHSNPLLVTTATAGEPFSVNSCGGIARTEVWTMTYDQSRGGWEVEGVESGVQSELAYEDQRYLSDKGEISFLIQAGTSPSTDGDRFIVHVQDWVMSVDGDLNNNGTADGGDIYMEVPARPVPYSFLAGPEGEGWREVNRKVGVVWPVTNSDRVLKVNVANGEVDAIWD